MDCNDVLRRLRYTFDLNDEQMLDIFSLADSKVTRGQVANWLKKEEDKDFQKISDQELAVFLNGLINKNRGKKEGPQPTPEEFLTNNDILRKLKIALNYKDVDLIDVFAKVDRRVSKHELSAFFRKSDHKNYRRCNDQILRNFLMGLQLKFRS
ncbi:MAG: DUF1456 family protein [Candidatus Marinimicrobia bacterium]|nr:DUF1456 family protein [Candidatus Neomarinimicrobiota bacterium]